jgi:pyruvate kinase
MELYWGVRTRTVPQVQHVDELPELVDRLLIEMGVVEPNDLVCVTAGTPLSTAGTTNIIKVHCIGEG